MTSSRGAAGFAVTSLMACGHWPLFAGFEQQRIAFGRQRRQPALAILDSVADLCRILGRGDAHLVDDRAALLLEVHHRVDQLLDRIGANRRAIAGLDRLFLHLVADLAEGLEAL